MARKPIIRSNEHFYHLAARSNNKEFFELPLETVWNIMTSNLGLLQKEFDLKIPAFVLMNNHFHLLMLTPKEDIDRVMYFFMKRTTLAMQKHCGRINKIFGGRYKGCLIDNQFYLLNAYKYIYQNPLKEGLVGRAEEYRFSTLNPNVIQFLPFKKDEIVPLSLQSSCGLLESRWINETFSVEEASSIKHGLSRSQFALKRSRNTNKQISPKNNIPLT